MRTSIAVSVRTSSPGSRSRSANSASQRSGINRCSVTEPVALLFAGMDDIVATLYRQESRRVFSTLVRLLGSFDLAEDALHDAFIAASEQWPTQGVPANPVAWLVSTGRFRAIDRIRRERHFVALDDATEQVAVVYKRRHGGYGLIAPTAEDETEE